MANGTDMNYLLFLIGWPAPVKIIKQFYMDK